jgi:lysophospholipase L1-like esterase
MLDCIVLGDSIAVGTQLQRYECVSYAKGGINSWQWNKQFGNRDLTAGTVIISLGTNDHKHVKTQQELLAMRARVKASRVFWILPVGNSPKSEVPLEVIQRTVKEIAAKYNDTVLPITRVQSDGIHPSWAGYREIANKTKGN